MKRISLKIRFTKKLVLLFVGLGLVMTGSTAAFALYMQGESRAGAEAEHALSGGACTTLETIKLRRAGQRWVRKYVKTESADGVQRVRTALRVAALLAKSEQADLYQVVVFDQAGPTDRASWRGAAIGAEVLFSPDPSKVPGMRSPFVARYTDAKPNTIGLFHGPEVELTLADIQKTVTGMTDKTDCFDAQVEAARVLAEARANLDHGGAKATEGHGEEAAPAADTSGEHGEAAATGEHAAGEPEKKGFIGSMMAMLFGSSDVPPTAPAKQGAAQTPVTEPVAAEAPAH